jgi:outer membrane receptor protein involved in Fe transport
MMRRFAPLMVGAVLLANPARAQDSGGTNSDTATVQLPEVVVTALRGQDRLRRIPAASFVLTRDRIAESGATRVTSLLQTLPGLYGYKSGTNGDPQVVDPRGFTANGESSYLKLLVDGQDVRDVENGNVEWDWLFPHDIERLEVVEGPGAWVYGDGSEGGIVNIVRPSIPDGLHSDCGAQAGSFGLASGGIVLSGQSGGLAGSLRGAARRADGFRDHSRERVYSGGAEARARDGDRRLAINATLLDADRDDPGALRPDQIAVDRDQADTPFDFAHPQRILLSASLAQGEYGRSEWRLAPFVRFEDVEQVRTLLYQTKDHPTDATTAGAEVGWRGSTRVAGRAVAVTVSADGEQSRLRSRYYDSESGVRGPLRTDGESWRTSVSGFAGAQVTLDRRTTARLGLRQDAVRVKSETRFEGIDVDSRTFWLTSPFVAISREIAGPFTAYGSYSAAFRIPTLNQLFDRRPFDTEFGTVFISNPELDPQKSHGFELGGRYDGARGGWAVVSLYSILVRDEIDFEASTNSYANISRSWHRGAQLGVRQPIAGGLVGSASYTYAPTTVRGGENDGRQINAVPRHLAFAGLGWMTNLWSLEGGVRYVGPQFLDKANLHELPDFGAVDVSGSVKLARLRATARVQNLLDREFSDSGYLIDLGPGFQEERLYPAAGRGFSVSLTMD